MLLARLMCFPLVKAKLAFSCDKPHNAMINKWFHAVENIFSSRWNLWPCRKLILKLGVVP